MFFDFFTRSYQSKEYIDIINELQHVPALIEIDDPPEEAEPDCEAAEEIEADYAPPALTAETVERLFHACLAREGDTDIAGRVSPFRKVNGYPSDFKPYLFDRLQLLARQRDIRYLLGQVQAIAQGQRSVPVGAFRTDYRGRLWEDGTTNAIYLVYLAHALEWIGDFVLPPESPGWKGQARLLTDITPTLSPEDPDFPAWWWKNKIPWI